MDIYFQFYTTKGNSETKNKYKINTVSPKKPK